MPFEVMVVVLVAIGCTYELVKRIVAPGPMRNEKEILNEVRALRDEVRQLRQENHDVLLSLDSTVQHVDERVNRLENGMSELSSGVPAGGERVSLRPGA